MTRSVMNKIDIGEMVKRPRLPDGSVDFVKVIEEENPVREEARLLLGEAFKHAVNTDADHEWDILAEAYLECDSVVQGLINFVTTSVCGRSIPTLIKMAEQGDYNIDCDIIEQTATLTRIHLMSR